MAITRKVWLVNEQAPAEYQDVNKYSTPKQQAVETLLAIKRGESMEIENEKAPAPTKPAAPALKRYRNE